MKIAGYLCALCLTTTLAAPTQDQSIATQEDAIRALTNLYEIDIQTQPEDGTVKGIRIKRNRGTQGVSPAEEDEDYILPDLDIQKINDQTLSVNGIRLRRSDLSSLSDVELEKDIEAEASEIQEGEADERTRRAGAETLLGFLGSKITEKLSAIIGASSGHNSEPEHSYGPPVTQSYDSKSFDIWAFKKAILNTLLQAVKAIKGGVLAIGGQLVKAKGQLISTAGKVVATKGEAISGFGRQVAANALLTHPATTHHTAPATAFASAAIDHVPDTGYPSAGYPQASYGAPAVQTTYTSSISGSYGAPQQHGYNKRGASSQQFGVPQELPNDVQAGLLVLKPIHGHQQSSQYTKQRGSHSFGSRDSSGGYASQDSAPSPSELQPVVVQDIQHAQARSYYVRY